MKIAFPIYSLLLTQGKNPIKYDRSSGFTFLEMLIIVGLISILGAIAIPTWLAFIDNQRLNTAQNITYLAIRQAQSQAKKEKLTIQISFREYNAIAQWAIHEARVSPAQAQWHNFDQDIILDPETTLHYANGVRHIQFDFLGAVRQPPLGRVTLSTRYGGHRKRCVFVSTILGALRTAKEHPHTKDGKYCY
jgi:type II secretory pathway pseudopilin PulG